ncbi:hypothetical protein CEXT_10691 [Caerostris extrusa]|uniref:Uncharacterized protein n=1 Tax=Caerostris extrusa TaxID=172846 RepID=A0AAV4VMA3_CAEEX|nr:hypothetical protein CEXT_10691 [Caerostris extrusa]
MTGGTPTPLTKTKANILSTRQLSCMDQRMQRKDYTAVSCFRKEKINAILYLPVRRARDFSRPPILYAAIDIPIICVIIYIINTLTLNLEVYTKKRRRFHRDLNSDRWIQSPEC